MDDTDRKAYVLRTEVERGETHEQDTVVYTFCDSAKDAMYYNDSDRAEEDCAVFNQSRVIISSVRGGTHVLNTFQVESRDDKFVISCTGPFISAARSV